MTGSSGLLTVEACVRTWKSILIAIITVDVESAEAIHALKLLEPVKRDLAGSSDKLEELGTLLFVVRTNGSPKPLNLRGRSRIIVILCVALPIVNVNLRKA
jgi:hypothetical protein